MIATPPPAMLPSTMRNALLALALLASPALAFEPTGEVLFRGGSSASFDGERIVGPTVNLTLAEGGYWTGDILGENVDLTVSPDRIRGPNIELVIQTSKDTTTVRGNAFGRRINLEYGPRGLSGRVGTCNYDFKRLRDGGFGGNVGCMSPGSSLPRVGSTGLRLVGQAALPSPPQPQFAIALVATLPG
jgi:hypothetical protein